MAQLSNLENYKNIIENIYGPGIASFSVTGNTTNDVIGALNNRVSFQSFSICFKERLKRLNNLYKSNPTKRNDLLVQVNEIASNNNWEGAYAELVAYDFLNEKISNYLYESILLNKDINNKRTFAKELGKPGNANLDGYYKGHQVYFDVKCLKDIIAEILEGIYKDLKKNISFSDFTILAEYPIDSDYKLFQLKRKDILNELQGKINVQQKTGFVKSTVINDLSFRLRWGSGVLLTTTSYAPYRHAQETHQLIYNYANKFVKDKSFFLVFVIFPWFNGIISDFNDMNKDFYRAFARRIFLQYKNKKIPFKELNKNFQSNKTVYTVTKKLSGILFLEDHTLSGENPYICNAKGYFYSNPNADHKIRGMFYDYLLSLDLIVFDDFYYDNY